MSARNRNVATRVASVALTVLVAVVLAAVILAAGMRAALWLWPL